MVTDAKKTKKSPTPQPQGNNNTTPPRLAASTEMGLRATCLSKAYKKRPVLRNVSFKVDRGEAVGLLGPNGAGKTTSFYCITGLITPDSGTVTVDGVDVTALALSGGERRRVEIARALASSPSFILLDEPLAGIDPISVGEIRDLVSHLKHRGIGVLITDHNVRETLDIIDRAYILHDGVVLMEGNPQDVIHHEDVRRVYLGEKFAL